MLKIYSLIYHRFHMYKHKYIFSVLDLSNVLIPVFLLRFWWIYLLFRIFVFKIDKCGMFEQYFFILLRSGTKPFISHRYFTKHDFGTHNYMNKKYVFKQKTCIFLFHEHQQLYSKIKKCTNFCMYLINIFDENSKTLTFFKIQ